MRISDLKYYFGNNVTLTSKVEFYLSNYFPDLFRPIEVCIMNGDYHVENGQVVVDSGTVTIVNGHHRKAMLLILGMEWVQVYIRRDIKTDQDLTEYYVRLNRSIKEEKKTPNNLHMNEAMISGSDDEYIDSVNEGYGIGFSEFKAENSVRCVEACRYVVKKFGRFIYERTIFVLVEAFNGDPDSLTSVIIKNIARHLKENEGVLDFEGWIDSYINNLQSRPAVEWNKRWTPTKSRALSRQDLIEIGKAVARDLGYNPRYQRAKKLLR